mmetsp:Transcript_36040/g.87106  ORF Transcript_36040/g.87106 Transcript_36040/m.87106 type:complete len:90 (+) Transcript_36040:1541-1810(+)
MDGVFCLVMSMHASRMNTPSYSLAILPASFHWWWVCTYGWQGDDSDKSSHYVNAFSLSLTHTRKLKTKQKKNRKKWEHASNNIGARDTI